MSAPGVKPLSGTTIEIPVTVSNVFSHVTVWIAAFVAAIPAIIALLVQFQELPGLPTNILAWMASAVTILGTIATIYARLHGSPTITPTMAAKVINEEAITADLNKSQLKGN